VPLHCVNVSCIVLLLYYVGVVSVSSSADMALMTTLLGALRNYSTTSASSGCHGSPVMILKEMIDRHFTEAAAAAAVSSPVSPRLPVNAVSHVCIMFVSCRCHDSSYFIYLLSRIIYFII